ncbi:MAG: hypothetical protein Q8Q36_02780, partial [bacterium]|nr:hypothetical protein [bacterium]
ELEELTADPGKPAEGIVIESHMDPKRGISGALIVKDGALEKGNCMAIEGSVSPVRIMEDFLGKPLGRATPGTPVFMAGFSEVPRVGAAFRAFDTKKDAERAAAEWKEAAPKAAMREAKELTEEEAALIKVIPLSIKADTQGTLEAVEKEIGKVSVENVVLKIVQKGIGPVTESDVKVALGSVGTIVLGFGVKVEPKARDLAERSGIIISMFDVIYKMAEWLAEEAKKRKPKVAVEETLGRAKILRVFSREKDRQVVGGRVQSGALATGAQAKILRRDFEIARGKILELQSQKLKTKEVGEGKEFGLLIEAKMDIAEGDIIEPFIVVEK